MPKVKQGSFAVFAKNVRHFAIIRAFSRVGWFYFETFCRFDAKGAYKFRKIGNLYAPEGSKAAKRNQSLVNCAVKYSKKALRHSKIASELSKNTVKRSKKNQALIFSLMQALFERSMRERSPQ